MNQRDIDNVRFLINCTPEQLRNWYDSVSEADLIYASLIMENYATLLDTEIKFQNIEQQIAAMPVMTEAQAVIAMIRG